MFRVLKYEFPKLEKRIKSIGRKLDRYNLNWRFEVISETLEKINVYHESFGTVTKIKEVIEEVVNYEFEMEVMKLGDWTPYAIIDHNVDVYGNDKNNMVYAIGEVELLPEWWSIQGNCEHCKSNRKRNKTVILQDLSGNFKQVGTTCIKGFTGISADDIIRLYAEIHGIFLKDVCAYGEDYVPSKSFAKTERFLAFSIEEIDKNGYKKGETKSIAFDDAMSNKIPKAESIKKSKMIINFFSDVDLEYIDADTDFYRNIRASLLSDYSKYNGFVSYAPLAYTKIIETIEKQRIREEQKKISQWQGNIGDKISIEVTYRRTSYYDTCFNGYSPTTQCIHTFTDDYGNVFKWNTSKFLTDIEPGTVINVKGIIKKHDEYDGEKQTVLTRCKIFNN